MPSMSVEDLGEGPIPPGRIETELRIVRHVIQTQVTQQKMVGELARDLVGRVAVAESKAETAAAQFVATSAAIAGLQYDIYGHPDRHGDTGLMGEIKREIASMRKQQWAILLALMAAVLTGVFDLLVKVTH